MADRKVEDLGEHDATVAAARQAAFRLGLEETIECPDSELVETKAADRGEDDATEDVAVDLDGLGRVLLTLLDFAHPDVGDRLEPGPAVQIAVDSRREPGGDLLLEAVHGRGG